MSRKRCCQFDPEAVPSRPSCATGQLKRGRTSYIYKPPDKSVYWKTIFLYFSPKTYAVGIQKNPLNETVLLSTQNTIMFKLIGKKNIIAILC